MGRNELPAGFRFSLISVGNEGAAIRHGKAKWWCNFSFATAVLLTYLRNSVLRFLVRRSKCLPRLDASPHYEGASEFSRIAHPLFICVSRLRVIDAGAFGMVLSSRPITRELQSSVNGHISPMRASFQS
jgi:hypothetical protein